MKTKILFTIAAALTACVFLLSEGVSAANGKTDKKSIRLDVGQAEITEGDSITPVSYTHLTLPTNCT